MLLIFTNMSINYKTMTIKKEKNANKPNNKMKQNKQTLNLQQKLKPHSLKKY